EEIYELPPQR
ncbi:hypothetical protein THAOC_34007, partial [Thalassiosira oceanica]